MYQLCFTNQVNHKYMDFTMSLRDVNHMECSNVIIEMLQPFLQHYTTSNKIAQVFHINITPQSKTICLGHTTNACLAINIFNSTLISEVPPWWITTSNFSSSIKKCDYRYKPMKCPDTHNDIPLLQRIPPTHQQKTLNPISKGTTNYTH